MMVWLMILQQSPFKVILGVFVVTTCICCFATCSDTTVHTYGAKQRNMKENELICCMVHVYIFIIIIIIRVHHVQTYTRAILPHAALSLQQKLI